MSGSFFSETQCSVIHHCQAYGRCGFGIKYKYLTSKFRSEILARHWDCRPIIRAVKIPQWNTALCYHWTRSVTLKMRQTRFPPRTLLDELTALPRPLVDWERGYPLPIPHTVVRLVLYIAPQLQKQQRACPLSRSIIKFWCVIYSVDMILGAGDILISWFAIILATIQ